MYNRHSKVHNFLIIDELAPRFPSSVAGTFITSTSATIQWMLTDSYNSSRPETFIVSYGVSSGQLNMSTPGVTANPTTQTYSTQLNSLQPGTEYFYQVKSFNRFDTVISHERFITADDSEFTQATFVLTLRLAEIYIVLVGVIIITCQVMEYGGGEQGGSKWPGWSGFGLTTFIGRPHPLKLPS